MSGPAPIIRYRVTGMDCAHDAADIEAAARAVEGVREVRVSVATQLLSLAPGSGDHALSSVEAAVRTLGYQLDRLAPGEVVSSGAPAIAPGYRRALWIVVLLNVGYGAIEMAGGFLSRSQALKADALDFLGDGLISLLGLVAIGWSLRWRARSALLQGVFLGALGVGVLATTAHRVMNQRMPEPELMGIFGLVALAVNVAAAVALLPHRTGDANARAIWLFSRNDAIGNAAVVVAAALVAWMRSPWPDLVVAVGIAGLFMHSAWVIVRDAMGDLRDVPA